MVCSMCRLTTSTRSSLDRDTATTDSTVCGLLTEAPTSAVPPASLHSDTGRRSPAGSETTATSKQTSSRRRGVSCRWVSPDPAFDCGADDDDDDGDTAAKLWRVRLMRCPGWVSMIHGQSEDPRPVSSVITLARNPDDRWPSYPARIRTALCLRHDALSPVSTTYNNGNPLLYC